MRCPFITDPTDSKGGQAICWGQNNVFIEINMTMQISRAQQPNRINNRLEPARQLITASRVDETRFDPTTIRENEHASSE